MNIGNNINKIIQTNLYNDIFLLGSTKEIHHYKNYYMVTVIMHTYGNHPVININITLSRTIK